MSDELVGPKYNIIFQNNLFDELENSVQFKE